MTPTYPFVMQRAGIKGNVVVAFVVDPKGNVTEPHIVQASHPAFRDAAVAAVGRWKFKPGRVDGRAVSTLMQVPIFFRFDDRSGNTGWAVKRPRKFSDDIPEALRWDKAPELVEFNPPVYPREAFLEGRKGKVKVRFVVGPDGWVLEAQSSGSGDLELQAAAVAAVQTFRFKPAKQEGRPCGALLNMEFDFRRSSSSDAEVTSEMKRLAKVLAADPSQIVPLGRLDAGLRPLTRQSPVKPYSFRKATEPVEVRVEFIINQRGSAELPRALGEVDSELAFAAVQAVAGWQFTVPRIDGEPVDARVVVPIVFEPDEKS